MNQEYTQIDSVPFNKRKSKSTERSSRQQSDFQAQISNNQMQQLSSKAHKLKKLVAPGIQSDQ